MKTQIDLKSAFIGLVLGAGIMFTVAAGTDGSVGRYQITGITTGNGAGACFLADTKTGEVWAADLHQDWNPKADRFWSPKNQ